MEIHKKGNGRPFPFFTHLTFPPGEGGKNL